MKISGKFLELVLTRPLAADHEIQSINKLQFLHVYNAEGIESSTSSTKYLLVDLIPQGLHTNATHGISHERVVYLHLRAHSCVTFYLTLFAVFSV